MRIDISCGADVAMSEPFLDVFQRNSVCVKQTGTTVSKIMEANPPHSMLLKEVRESRCQIWVGGRKLFKRVKLEEHLEKAWSV